ncbi:ABC transporter permease [Hymenobacter sp. ASUV-10]|uniref:ABC transporter permease n=1 Tax=Hymenobacter aranciens TaxID=3063996 RepID=A0ABT9B8V0_9BACT|nr:ABC transporter permease [Hymenobacter sp. ASUV-10]MDO7874607.1 ABC transporter permease [Hymenobacter sp. ASUV-10]
MVKQWLWRLGQTAVGIWLLVSLVFLLSHLGPVQGDDALLPAAGDLNTTSTPSSFAQRQATRRAVQHRLGLDQPVFYLSWQPATDTTSGCWSWHGLSNQYHHWLLSTVHGDLGTSLGSREPVARQLWQALVYTLPLVGITLLGTLLLAWQLAERLAMQPRWQPLLQAALTGLQALPLFAIALALLLLLANPSVAAWFPPYGLGQATPAELGWGLWISTYAYHATLPALSLMLSVLPAVTLQLAGALRDELAQPYTATAYAKGLSQPQVIRRHALRNALLPSLTQLTDLLPTLVAGTLVVEVVFALPGMGRLLVQAATTRDYPLLVGGVLLIGTARLLALLLADVLYGWADPRIR